MFGLLEIEKLNYNKLGDCDKFSRRGNNENSLKTTICSYRCRLPSIWSRRFVALLIDWIACSLIAIAFFYHPHAGHAGSVLTEPRLWTPLVFGIEDFLLTAFTGFTIGKRLLGLRVVRLDGRPVGLQRAFVRTLLLMLVVPAMMMDRDLRGLQDKAAGTAVIRL